MDLQQVYERQKPLFNGTIDPNGLNNPRAPWNILHGNAGHYDGVWYTDQLQNRLLTCVYV